MAFLVLNARLQSCWLKLEPLFSFSRLLFSTFSFSETVFSAYSFLQPLEFWKLGIGRWKALQSLIFQTPFCGSFSFLRLQKTVKSVRRSVGQVLEKFLLLFLYFYGFPISTCFSFIRLEIVLFFFQLVGRIDPTLVALRQCGNHGVALW